MVTGLGFSALIMPGLVLRTDVLLFCRQDVDGRDEARP
jgi:hypothetical protein